MKTHRGKKKSKRGKKVRRWHVMLSLLPVGVDLVGVEVGVRKAECSIRLLEKRPLLILHLVDPWEEYTAEDSTNSGKVYTQDKKNVDYQKALENVQPYGGRAVVHKMTSMEALGEVESTQRLDFVFVDGNHSYKHCSEDIREWWTRIKPNGWMAVHDYGTKFYGIDRAVNEFVERMQIKPVVGADDLAILTKP